MVAFKWPKSRREEIEEAKAAIESALADFAVSNDTTEEQMLNMAKAALPKGSHVIVQRVFLDFYVKASTTAEGELYVDFSLNCGEQYDLCSLSKTIPMVDAKDAANIEEDQ